MITDKQIIAEVSVLFSDSRKRNWSPGPPPLPPPPVSISALRETSASGKLRSLWPVTYKANHPGNVWYVGYVYGVGLFLLFITRQENP